MDEAALTIAQPEELYKSEVEFYGFEAVSRGRCRKPPDRYPGSAGAACRCHQRASPKFQRANNGGGESCAQTKLDRPNADTASPGDASSNCATGNGLRVNNTAGPNTPCLWSLWRRPDRWSRLPGTSLERGSGAYLSSSGLRGHGEKEH